MKRTVKLLVAFVAIAAAVYVGYKFFYKKNIKEEAVERTAEPLLALYDRHGNATAAQYAGCKHIAVKWATTGNRKYETALMQLIATKSPVLITVETWQTEKFVKQNILEAIAAGDYDEKIISFAKILAQQKQTVMLRLNPEMEVYVDVYPWQKQAPTVYAKAFNHFASLIKKEAPSVKMVWAPAGYPGTEEYWPGAKWVDMVSVTLKGRSEMLTTNYPEEKSLQQLIFRKLHRARFFDKPVLLIGSDKLTAKDFERQGFDAATKYIEENKVIEFIDTGAADDTSHVLRNDSMFITGAFDPSNHLLDSTGLSCEHIFVNIWDLKGGEFKSRFDSAMQRGMNTIVTMEPWKDEKLAKDPKLVENILKGSYDSLFEKLYSIIGHTNKTIYLRWLHEMEIPITRYPWQSQDPVMYIKAYRYFVDFIRNKKPAHIYFVWGPAGDRGSMEFWPGSDVVDYTSIAIYGLPDKNITDHNQQESFNNIFKRKFRRIWFAHKPLLITEFGVKGPSSYKAEWLAAAAATINANREIFGASYFNDTDSPKAWGDIEAPDWSISVPLYKNFLKQIGTAQ